MRFTHPELYRTRHWFPRENALVEMQHRGLLKRGMHWGELMQLLGLPDHSEEFDGEVKCTYDQNHNLLSIEESILPPKELWIYGLKSSQLTVEFDRPGQTALSFRWSYDEGGPEDWVW